MTLTIDLLRARAARGIGLLLWLHVPLAAGIALLRGASPWMPMLAVFGLALAVEVACVRRPAAASGHVGLALAYAAIIAILVGQMGGHPWQTDMHMYFFAALAIVSALCSWPAIVAFLAFVAVHHIALNFVLTALVFSGPPDILRVIVHAAILIAEAAALGALTFVLEQMFARSAAEMATIGAARAEAESLLSQRAVTQAQQSQFLSRLIDRITLIAEGDFSHQIAPVTTQNQCSRCCSG